MTDIYELSESISSTLIATANGDSVVFALLEPRDDDTPDRKKRLAEELVEINDLIQLDLLKDVSKDFIDQIAHCKASHGFGYKVVAMTDTAVLMFRKTGKERVT